MAAGTFYDPVDFGDGSVSPSISGNNFIVKYRFDHSVAWKRFIPGPAEIRDVAMTPDGGAIVVGSFKGTIDFGPGNPVSSDDVNADDIFIVSFTGNGADGWTRTFTTGVAENAFVSDIDVATNGLFAVAGQYRTSLRFNDSLTLSGGTFQSFVAGFSASGNVAWAKNLPFGSVGATNNPLAIDPAGNVLVGWWFLDPLVFAGRSYTTSQGDSIALRYSSSGEELWAFRSSNTTSSGHAQVAYDPFGRIVVGLSFNTPLRLGTDPLYTPDGSDVAVVRFNDAGTYQNSIILGGAGDQKIYELRVDTDGDLFVNTTGVASVDGWLVPSGEQLIKFRSDDTFGWGTSGDNYTFWISPGGRGTLLYTESRSGLGSVRWVQLSE